MSEYRPGEIVDITIKGARVHRHETAGPGFCVFEMDGGCHTIFIDSDKVTVERVAPAEWPPREGDLWRARKGDLWFASTYTPNYDDTEDSKGIDEQGVRVVLLPQYTDETPPGYGGYRPEVVSQRYGPLKLVHREDGEGR